MKIRLMVSSELDQVVRLHLIALPYTISSKIGKNYLNNLYKKILSTDGIHTCLVATEKNKIVGVVTLTCDLKKTQKLLNPTHSPHLFLEILNSLLKQKISLNDLYYRLYFEFKIKRKFKHPYVTILTLFVKPNMQRKGIGKRLIQSLSKILNKKNIKEIYVDTLITNSSAIAFYKKNNFRISEKLNDSYIFCLQL